MLFPDDDPSKEKDASGPAPSGTPETTPSKPSAEGDTTSPDDAAEAPETAEEAGAEEPASTPEVIRDYHQEAIDRINEVTDQQDETSRQRYRGLFGVINRIYNSEGKRTKAETLEKVGEWQKKHWYHNKWVRIGAMAGGGLGIAAAMTFTGGLGAVITPILWSIGVRAGWNSALETVEQLGWGRGRSRLELETQATLSQKIAALKAVVTSGEATPESYEEALNAMIEAQRGVQERQTSNLKFEHKLALFRSIASSVLTIGTGVFAGVPLGTHHYKGVKEVTEITDKAGHIQRVTDAAGNPIHFDQTHTTFWNFRGGQFAYNPNEIEKVKVLVAHSRDLSKVFTEHFGMLSHSIGHGLPAAEKAGLVSAFTLASYPAFEQSVINLADRRRRREAETSARPTATEMAAPAGGESIAPSSTTTAAEEEASSATEPSAGGIGEEKITASELSDFIEETKRHKDAYNKEIGAIAGRLVELEGLEGMAGKRKAVAKEAAEETRTKVARKKELGRKLDEIGPIYKIIKAIEKNDEARKESEAKIEEINAKDYKTDEDKGSITALEGEIDGLKAENEAHFEELRKILRAKKKADTAAASDEV